MPKTSSNKSNYEKNSYARSNRSFKSDLQEVTYEKLMRLSNILPTINMTGLELRSTLNELSPSNDTTSFQKLEASLGESVMQFGRAEVQLLTTKQVSNA